MAETDDKAAVLARYRNGPAVLDRALAGIGEPELDAIPAQGGWTIRKIVHHIVDGDDLWKIGLKIALGPADGEFTLAWYGQLSQDAWTERWAYAQRPLDGSLVLLRAIRSHVLELVEPIPEAWARAVRVRTPVGGTERVTVGDVIAMQADHVEHHAARILALRREFAGGDEPTRNP